MNVVEIEGIGPERAERLARVGVVTTDDLLSQGGQAGGRRELAAATGFTTALILEWVNRADLLRLNGVGSEYADLLEAAGVDSPVELAHRNPANLAAKLREMCNAKPALVRRVPGESEITDWIEQAKAMPRMVWHGSVGRTADPAPVPPPTTERSTSPAEPEMVAGARTEPAAAVPADAASPAAQPTIAASDTRPPVAAATTSAPLTSPRPTPMTHRREGLWFRIRRFLGLR